ncbi:hypothetical protein [Streptomyces chartreusis]|uniref:hypothetical protein n=1 Tax=Streptomyces chartreusis TaxID=1969 RepID=UPI002F91B7DA|nr:hypothetical protein OG938_45155 [Streptomyces chartreusis]WTA33334.1 hypothetical protein OIA45_45640 [Streptomyces chartreusis]
MEVKVLSSGELILASRANQKEGHFAPLATAMWIALRQFNGNPEDAAAKLSDVWEEEFHSVHSILLEQIGEWRDGGFIEVAH